MDCEKNFATILSKETEVDSFKLKTPKMSDFPDFSNKVVENILKFFVEHENINFLDDNLLSNDEISFFINAYPNVFKLIHYPELLEVYLQKIDFLNENEIYYLTENIINILEFPQKFNLIPVDVFILFYESGLFGNLFKFPKLKNSITLNNLITKRTLFDVMSSLEFFFNPLRMLHNNSLKLNCDYFNSLIEICICVNENNLGFLSKCDEDTIKTIITMWELTLESYNMGHKYKLKWSNLWLKDVPNLNTTLDVLIMNIFGIPRQFPEDYTLREIIEIKGYLTPFYNERYLMRFYENVEKNLNEIFIFVFTENSKLKPKNCKLNLTMDYIDEYSTNKLIGIGNPLVEFQVTTIDEIVECWKHAIECGEEFYKSPIDGNPLSPEKVIILKSIATHEEHKEFNKIYNEIKEIIENSQAGDKILKTEFETNQKDNQKKIIRFMKDIFLVGMYMRRWDGKGPYPIKSISTLNNEVEYYDVIEFSIGEGHGEEYNEDNDLVLAKVGKCLMKILEDFKNFNLETKHFIKSIKTTEAYTKKIKDELFWNGIAKETINGNYCIRMASDMWIGTGARFFSIIKKNPKILNGFKMNEFVTII